jgi:hypothetical protein
MPIKLRSRPSCEHSQHDADPGFQEFNRLADLLQPDDPLVYGGEDLHAV